MYTNDKQQTINNNLTPYIWQTQARGKKKKRKKIIKFKKIKNKNKKNQGMNNHTHTCHWETTAAFIMYHEL